MIRGWADPRTDERVGGTFIDQCDQYTTAPNMKWNDTEEDFVKFYSTPSWDICGQTVLCRKITAAAVVSANPQEVWGSARSAADSSPSEMKNKTLFNPWDPVC